MWPPNSTDVNLVDYLVRHSGTCVRDQSSWHRWAATASTACVVQVGAVADWRCSWPMANTLASLCSCKRQIFWTYFVTINFSLYLMNFMFHTMLDAAGDALRIDYKTMKCDVSFSQDSVSYDRCKNSQIYKCGHICCYRGLVQVIHIQNYSV